MESTKDSKDRHEQVRGWQHKHIGNLDIVRIREVCTSTVQNIPLTKGGVPIDEGRRIVALTWGPCEVTTPWGSVRPPPSIDTITHPKLDYIKTVLHISPIFDHSGAVIVNLIL